MTEQGHRPEDVEWQIDDGKHPQLQFPYCPRVFGSQMNALRWVEEGSSVNMHKRLNYLYEKKMNHDKSERVTHARISSPT